MVCVCSVAGGGVAAANNAGFLFDCLLHENLSHRHAGDSGPRACPCIAKIRARVPGDSAMMSERPVSCGTLVVNQRGQLLLCHVTNTAKWDIPKGMRDPGEAALAAAMREMQEEAGIAFDAKEFRDLGCFDYRSDKKLHLFMVRAAPDFDNLDHLACTSYFPHEVTGAPTLEVDGFRWAFRAEIRKLCWPKMAQRLLSLEW